jgi:8-oxo-dGTP pyrophosphatase MutT (NUDIX family)
VPGIVKKMIDKVVCCILNISEPNNPCLLLFLHPNAGIQFPKGTVEKKEKLENACIREAYEETGLKFRKKPEKILEIIHNPNETDYWTLDNCFVYSKPDKSSFNWIKLQRGIHLNKLCSNNGFTQINYSEWNNEEKMDHINYSFCGWIENENITNKLKYTFYKIETKTQKKQWNRLSDNQNTILSWYPTNNLPRLYKLQEMWKEKILDSLK